MEVENTDFVGGSLRISTAVLARIAKLAALEAMGVQQVRSATPEVKALLGRNGFARSVAVSMQEGVAEITVGIVVPVSYTHLDGTWGCGWRPSQSGTHGRGSEF